jgi:hypothetical protein
VHGAVHFWAGKHCLFLKLDQAQEVPDFHVRIRAPTTAAAAANKTIQPGVRELEEGRFAIDGFQVAAARHQEFWIEVATMAGDRAVPIYKMAFEGMQAGGTLAPTSLPSWNWTLTIRWVVCSGERTDSGERTEA